jgi:hypothetical protein
MQDTAVEKLGGCLPAICFRRFGYSLFTAADEKVPLSMGQVKWKPQYLVLPWRSGEPKPQTWEFSLWKARIIASGAGFGSSCAPVLVHFSTAIGR